MYRLFSLPFIFQVNQGLHIVWMQVRVFFWVASRWELNLLLMSGQFLKPWVTNWTFEYPIFCSLTDEVATQGKQKTASSTLDYRSCSNFPSTSDVHLLFWPLSCVAGKAKLPGGHWYFFWEHKVLSLWLSSTSSTISYPMPIQSESIKGGGFGFSEEEGGSLPLRCLAICFGISSCRYWSWLMERNESEMLRKFGETRQ